MVFDRARCFDQIVGLRLERYECVLRHLELAAYTKTSGRCKTETWVMVRVASTTTAPTLSLPHAS